MQITAVETFPVAPRWLFVKISTDAGFDRWGEATLEGDAEAVGAALTALRPQLPGADPLYIENHWQRLTKGGFYRGGPVLASAVSGLDQALRDIAGRAHGVPVHELLGGPVRDWVRVYGWIGGDCPADLGTAARAPREAGLSAVKMNAGARLTALPSRSDSAQVVERARQVREALGDDRDFAIDFHGRVAAPAAARLIRQLEDLHPLFVEEPVAPEHDHANLRRLTERRARRSPPANGSARMRNSCRCSKQGYGWRSPTSRTQEASPKCGVPPSLPRRSAPCRPRIAPVRAPARADRGPPRPGIPTIRQAAPEDFPQ